jgi:hypothetical protein
MGYCSWAKETIHSSHLHCPTGPRRSPQPCCVAVFDFSLIALVLVQKIGDFCWLMFRNIVVVVKRFRTRTSILIVLNATCLPTDTVMPPKSPSFVHVLKW